MIARRFSSAFNIDLIENGTPLYSFTGDRYDSLLIFDLCVTLV